MRTTRWLGFLGLAILVLITINTIVTKPHGVTGIPVGQRVPPFAAPLAVGDLSGDVNVATHDDDGQAGDRAACSVRGAQILNICQLYSEGPVVLALFVDGGGCASVLTEMEALVRAFPDVRFAAVAIKGQRAGVRKLVSKDHLTFPVGLDPDGVLATVYDLASCPQVSFIDRGGVVQSRALLDTPAPGLLRERVAALASSTVSRVAVK